MLKAIRICCALAFVLVLGVCEATAQGCEYGIYPAADYSMPADPTVDAATGEDCPDYSSQTEVWIHGTTWIECHLGSEFGTVCVNFSGGPQSRARGHNLGYGYWTGFSKHFGIRNSDGSWLQLGPIRSATLYAGEPNQPPARCESWEMWNEQTGSCVAYNTPILIPLTQGRAMKLTSAERGVLFDMNADGLLDWTGWTDWNSKLAFLAIDRNGNGIIDNGSELFGDHTIAGARNGFIALAKMNMELNGGMPRASINADEPIFERLLLWEDENHNGISEPHEIQPAAQLLSEIGLGYVEHNRRDGHGNLMKWQGWASLRTGPGRNQVIQRRQQEARQLAIFDVYFVTKR